MDPSCVPRFVKGRQFQSKSALEADPEFTLWPIARNQSRLMWPLRETRSCAVAHGAKSDSSLRSVAVEAITVEYLVEFKVEFKTAQRINRRNRRVKFMKKSNFKNLARLSCKQVRQFHKQLPCKLRKSFTSRKIIFLTCLSKYKHWKPPKECVLILFSPRFSLIPHYYGLR